MIFYHAPLFHQVNDEVDDDGEAGAISHQVGQIVGGLASDRPPGLASLACSLPGPMINSFDQLTFQLSNSIPHIE